MGITLDSFTGPSRAAGSEIIFRDCPVCGSVRWKTYLNPETGGWFCHAGEHGGGGQVDVAAETDERVAKILALLRPGKKNRIIWPEMELPDHSTKYGVIFKTYLANRGIPESVAKKLFLRDGTGDFAGRVVIPYMDTDLRLIYWNTRRYIPWTRGPKYKTAPGQHPLYMPDTSICPRCAVIVEGPFDAIKVWMAGYRAIGLGGKHLSKYLMPDLLDAVADADDIVVMLDRDALADSMKIRSFLAERGLPARVAVTVAGDPGGCTLQQIKESVG